MYVYSDLESLDSELSNTQQYSLSCIKTTDDGFEQRKYEWETLQQLLKKSLVISTFVSANVVSDDSRMQYVLDTTV